MTYIEYQSRYLSLTMVYGLFNSSLFIDEDGDIAHEFYRESKTNRGYTFTRCIDNIRPQVSSIIHNEIISVY